MGKFKRALLTSQFGAIFFLVIIDILAYFRISEAPMDFPKLETFNDFINFSFPWWMGLSIFFFLGSWFRQSKESSGQV